MSLLSLLGAIVSVLLFVAVGVALRHFGAVEREGSGVLNGVIVYVALPALIFVSIARAPLSWELLKITGVAWAVSLVGVSVAWEIAHVLKMPPRSAGAFVLVAALGNTGYLGYPIARALLGASALPGAVFYDVFGSVAVLFTVGIAVAARYGEHEGRVHIVRELLTFPAMLALLAALAFRFVPWPAAVSNAVIGWLDVAANMAVPLIMVSLGISLDFSGLQGSLARIGAASAIKLVLLPAIAAAIVTYTKDTQSMHLVVLQAGMPSMMLTLVVGQRFKLDVGLIASVVLVTTVLCLATIPVAQYLVP